MRTILTVLLAVAWMPLTAHCAIESVTGWETLRCASVEAAGDRDGSPCESGSCCTWEWSQCRLPATQPQITAPVSFELPQITVRVAPRLEEAAAADLPATAPPKPPKPWQFSLRAALPVRAPSIAS